MNFSRRPLAGGFVFLLLGLGYLQLAWTRTLHSAEAPLPEGCNGISVRHPGDAGIGTDPAVIFADGFESGFGIWDGGGWGGAATTTVAAHVHGGSRALELTMQNLVPGSEAGQGVGKHLTDGYDVLFVRYYVKFEQTADMLGHNHNGVSIGARAPGILDAKPGIPSDGYSDYVALMEPSRGDATIGVPGEWNFYVYLPEQRSQWGDHWVPNGTSQPISYVPQYFGPDFIPRPNIVPERERWICCEVMLKANTPGLRDGRLALWLDGKLSADFLNLRWRDVATLKSNDIAFGMSTLYSSNTARITTWYDDVVVATTYIGPKAGKPELSSASTALGKVGSPFSYRITATHTPAGYGATGLPAGLSVNAATGLISGTPTAAGTSSATMTATNASGTGTYALSIVVAPTTAPSITSAATASSKVGGWLTYQITATHGPASYNATGLPAGLSVNTATGLISGTPLQASTGLAAMLTATNASGTGAATLSIAIAPAAGAPVITSAVTASGAVGSNFVYQITATHAPTSFGANGLPAPLTVNTSSGLISGTPASADWYSIPLSATNASGTGLTMLRLSTVMAKPVFTTQPVSQTVTAPGSATFGAAATGSPAYQWYSAAPGSSTFVQMWGQTSPSFTIGSTSPAMNGTRYCCGAKNSGGVAGSAVVTLTVNGASQAAPSITTQPVSRTVTESATATFSVVAAGSPAPAHQWQSAPSGSPAFSAIGGATAGIYVTPATTAAMNGTQYRCVIGNSAGTATSTVATLGVVRLTAARNLSRDFDGDRKDDVLHRHPSSGHVFLWLMK